MASIASSALKSASRLGCGAAVAAAPLRALPRAALVAKRAGARRAYVTETKKNNAQVETAIKLDKKDFVDLPPPQMDGNDIMVSPMARTLPTDVSSLMISD